MAVIPVIIAGGKGQRLWPVSREQTPKPFVDVNGSGKTLLQGTLARLAALGNMAEPIVVCGDAHKFLVRAQAQALNLKVTLILEPEGRNTAPAVCAAAEYILSVYGPDAVMLVLPADHLIRHETAFAAAIHSGLELAQQNYLVTFAIKPTEPATGYGYLRLGQAINAEHQQYKLAGFIEKPDLKLAEEFVAAGDYAWNSGMFVFKVSSILEAFAEHEPETLRFVREALPSVMAEPIPLNATAFGRARSVSIDYAIMEKAKNVATVVADLGWNDLGDWLAVWQTSCDATGVSLAGNSLALNCKNAHLQSEGPLLVGIGLENVFAIAMRDAILVTAADQAQNVRVVVEQLERLGKTEATHGAKVFCPWGWHLSLHSGPGFQVKEIIVYPNAKLSLQRHKFRSEQWVCLAGEGLVTRGEQRSTLKPNQTIDIPLGVIHRLENSGQQDLHIIEIQIGSYTGEDDIERLEDIYGRV